MIIWSCSSSNGPEDSGDGTIDNPSAAPEFNLKTETGAEISLSDFRGKIVYLFFIG
jgi:cytochrome oxidase Cu insertion factor (SCO1/SenC/PrrC family)